MYKKNTIIFLALIIIILFNVRIYVNKNEIEDVYIISHSLVDKDDAKAWAMKKGATEEFINLADLYFKYSEDNGNVNPALAYVQAAKETAFGNFGGVLDASYHNPCGLKTKDGGGDKEVKAHKKFKTWDDGVKAHLDHLALYAGAKGYPRSKTFDTRHFVQIKGKAKTAKSLGAKWAPSKSYGDEIIKLYNDLILNSECVIVIS